MAFHNGDLQSGISRAIIEQKLVACFIRADDNEESQIWEQLWLGGAQKPAIGDMFAMKAVLLKIEFGSQEMAFLRAFCPVSTAPTFVVIDKGQVLEKVESGASQQEFVERISKALGLDMFTMREGDLEAMRVQAGHGEGSLTQAAATEQIHTGTRSPSESGQATPASSNDMEEPSGTNSSHIAPQPAQAAPSADMSSLFPDRAQRLELEKAKREAAEKAERTARANARRKEAAEAEKQYGKGKGRASDVPASEQEKARRDWIVQQKQRKDEAKKERERILAQIEADKQERKARSQKERIETAAPSEPLLSPSLDASSRRRMGPGGMCNLLIRLFDGSSIKGRFEPSATLATAVRDWIKTTTAEQGKGNAADIPFTFKQIMAPQPSRSIEISEEHQTLADLGLVPNATLILAPVAGYTDAYSSSGRGYMSSALHYTYAVANTTTSIFSSALSYLPGFGTGAAIDSSSTNPNPSSHETESSDDSNTYDGGSDVKVKIKTLADQRAESFNQKKKDQAAEFYNGNSSAFEGRKDDDDHDGGTKK